MKAKSISLLSMATLFAVALSMSVSSCDNNSPTTPDGKGNNNGGKTPQVLDGPCVGTVAVTDCPAGTASVRYDEDGYLGVANMTIPDRNGVNCTFASPINVWNANIDVAFPTSGNGSLSYTAQDDRGTVEARLDIKQEQDRISVRPTFTSPPEGGKVSYDVKIYDDNGNLKASQNAIDITKPVYAVPQCSLKLITAAGWSVYQVNSQCIWKVLTNPCCRVTWVLPNGTIADGSKITLTERNEKGIYVYLETKNIFTSGNVATYTVKSASAIRTAQ
jgi:hypothetical protein